MSYFLGENCDGKNGHRMKLPVKTAPITIPGTTRGIVEHTLIVLEDDLMKYIFLLPHGTVVHGHFFSTALITLCNLWHTILSEFCRNSSLHKCFTPDISIECYNITALFVVWDRDEMAAILQITFSNAFSGMEMLEFLSWGWNWH